MNHKLFSSTVLENNKAPLLYGLIYVLFAVLMLHTGSGDLGAWINWSIYILHHGIGHIYESGSDYPPLYYYVLKGYGSWMGSDESIIKNVHWLKAITIACEFCSVFLLFRYVKKELQPWLFLFVMLNPGFLYNSVIWGQVDGIFGLFILSAILLVIYRYNTWALLLFVLCLNFKIQSIIFLPLVAFLLLHNIADYKGLRYAVLVLLGMAGLEALVILPFILSGTTEVLYSTMLNSVDKYPVVSMNAYNLWYWFLDGYLAEINDKGTWLGISYKNWGLIGFCLSSIIALLPIFITSIQQAINKNKVAFARIDQVFLSAALVTIAFFFFNTQMHERYSHYALIFLAAYFALTGNYLPFLLITTAYFLNMEAVLRALQFQNYSITLFDPRYIAGLYLVTIIYLYYLLYIRSNFFYQTFSLFRLGKAK
ncbi:MAG: hypothetical protein K0R51_3325 [Cytophagaceae bacterium]|jgi:Gpi18-like mannosyltransferase|nr:hypothetical protein [Cytophagaceae bacterium]